MEAEARQRTFAFSRSAVRFSVLIRLSKLFIVHTPILHMLSTKSSYPRIRQASDHSFIICFGEGISRVHHRKVVRLFGLLQSHSNPATQNVHPAYGSVLVSFNPLVTHPRKFDSYLRKLVDQLHSDEPTTSRLLEVPVCYDREFGADLEFVASHNHLTVDEIVRGHSSIEYLVYFLGFSPGFPYMGDLPEWLAAPRLPTPRLNVPAGSVAIGGNQTGIYPVSSPGGWRIIGRTPLRVFNPQGRPPTMLEMGDLVRFRPISVDEYKRILEGESKR